MNLHRFDVQTIKNVELRCKPFKTAKVQKWSKYNDLHELQLRKFDVKTSKNVELRRKTFKTAKQKYKINDLHRFDVKNIKTMLNYESDHWTQNEQKCWVTSQNILNNAELQKWYHYDELHAFDIKTNKNVELGRKHSKQRKTTKVIKIQWLASIWRQNEQKWWVRRKTFKTTQTTKVIKL